MHIPRTFCTNNVLKMHRFKNAILFTFHLILLISMLSLHMTKIEGGHIPHFFLHHGAFSGDTSREKVVRFLLNNKKHVEVIRAYIENLSILR